MLLISWAIWIARNQSIFQQKPPHWPSITTKLLADYSSIPEEDEQLTHRNITPKVINTSHPWAYFDGLAQEAGCGGGAILHLFEGHFYRIQMVLGRGTNNCGELTMAKNLILFALS